MKKVEIFLGNTSMLAYKQALLSIKPYLNKFDEKIIIVVPDKLSLLTEKSIFEYLDIDAYFNLEVMGINLFVQKILADCNLDIFCYNKEQSKFLIYRAIQNVKSDFLCFGKKVSSSFCEQIYGTISQLKTSCISNSDFAIDNTELNLNKFHDIKIIYDEYTRLLFGKQDSGEILNLFNSFAKDSNLLKDSRVLFLGFDSMTNQGLKAMETTIKFAKAFSISIAHSTAHNSRIYDKVILENLKTILSENDLKATYINCDSYTSVEKSCLLNNLYSGKITNKISTNSFANVVEATTFEDEIVFAGKTIVYQIKQKNKSFSDFAIICPNEYFHVIKRVFNEYDIQYYIDEPRILKSFDYLQFITCLLNFLDGKEQEVFIKILGFSFLKIDKSIIKILNDYLSNQESVDLDDINTFINSTNIDIEQKQLLIKLIADIQSLNNKINDIKLINNLFKVSDLYNIILDILHIFDIENKIYETSEMLSQKNELYLSKSYSQLYSKLLELFDNFKNLLPDEQITLFDFIDLINSIAQTKTVKSIPISLDCVQVISPDGFVGDVDTLFVLGNNEGLLPVNVKDCGLISDHETALLNLKFQVGPLVKTINRRNRYKLFEDLFFATSRLYVTYHKLQNDGREAFCSSLVTDLIKCYENFKIINTKTLFSYIDTISLNSDKFLFNAVNEKNLKNNYGAVLSGTNKQLIKNVLMAKNNTFLQTTEYNIQFGKKLFFPNGTTKVSQLEKYFICPKSNYFKYGLGLQKDKSKTLEPSDYGTLIHKVLENFIRFNDEKLESLSQTQIITWIANEFEYLATSEQFKNVFKKSNSAVLSLIKDELLTVCSFICEEQRVSRFKTNKNYLEYVFKDNALTLKTNSGNYCLSGIIDRVDFNNNFFRIIDYKTGANATYDGIKDIYTGKKIQTMLYYKALENITAKKCFGAFYMPIKFGYKNPEEFKYRLKGVYINDIDLVFDADTTLDEKNPKSRYFNTTITFGNSVAISGIERGAMPIEDFDNISNYTKKLCEKAIEEISSGFISSSPTAHACEYCEFANICKDYKNENLYRKLDFKVDKSSFKEINDGI